MSKGKARRRKGEFTIIFVNGKQKRVRRPPTIDGLSVDEFVARNADPIWLDQDEAWEALDQTEITDESPDG